MLLAVVASLSFAGVANAGTITRVGNEVVFTDPAADVSVNTVEVISFAPNYWITDHSESYSLDPSSGCDPDGQNPASVPAGWYSFCPGATSFRALLGGGNDTFGARFVFGGAAVTIPLIGHGQDGADTFVGDDADDLFVGGAGNDTLSGNGGRDRLLGDADADTLNGGAGSDVLDGGLNNDTMSGGPGSGDLVSYRGRADSITVHLGTTGADDGAAPDGAAGARDNINETDVEGVIGGSGNDSLWGDARTDSLRIQGGAGNDTLRGGAGPNVLIGNVGNDNIVGGNDLDFFSGGLGNDVINALDNSSDDVDCGGGTDAASSDAVDAREACEPSTTITARPAKTTSKRTATFKYTSTTPDATFQCQHDGGRWVACPVTGKTYSRLAPGNHNFKVRAKDVDGTVDPTPASFSWRVT